MKKIVAVLFSLCFTGQIYAKSIQIQDYFTLLSPSSGQIRTNTDVVEYLNLRHYSNLEFENELSSLVFDRYLKELDKNRYYFIASDIKDFEHYRYELDDALVNGSLETAFLIFNRYQKRRIERMIKLIDMLENGLGKFDFNRQETIQIDREAAKWAESTEALDDLWRKQLKNIILNKKLDGDTVDKIKTRLLKRYNSQLKRISQTTSEDAFRVYMRALTQIFDPHSDYFSPRASENFNIHMSLSLEGIGAVLTSKNDYTAVVRLVPTGPADKAGELKPGDKITGVAQGKHGEMISVVGWRLDNVVQKIRGPKGSIVRLEVIHASSTDNRHDIISIRRDKVKLEDKEAKKEVIEVTSNNKKFKIGIINLPTFYIDFEGSRKGLANYKSSTRDVKKLINELKAENVDGVIIDLRGNGGGSLQEANSLTGLFIKEGPTVQMRDFRHSVDQLNDTDPEVHYRGPLVVLVNRLSASASEIFAGAIRDYNRGLVVGSQTFGKGTVQALVDLDQGKLKITHAMFFRVSGESTQNRGILPDIELPSIYDKDEIGESALPRALPWYKIRAAEHSLFPDFEPFISELKSLHTSRVKNDKGYNILLEEVAKLKALSEKKSISLNEAVRKKERVNNESWQLDINNRKRALQNLPALKALEKKDEDDIVDTKEEDEDKLDPILTEAGYIMTDYISLIEKLFVSKKH
jgi:carboxyl-terminal processing protease